MMNKPEMKIFYRRNKFCANFLIIAAAIIISYLLTSFFLPGYIDKTINSKKIQPPYKVSSKAEILHKNLFIADMHADSLLFGRNLNIKENYGHVDVPRLIEGNVALQMFTVVTKAPLNLNINATKDDNDAITLLAVVAGWPVGTWDNLDERALYQASRLHKIAQNSQGRMIVIKSKADLEAYIAKRKDNQICTAALLGLEGAHALEGDSGNIDIFYQAGFRMIGLAHYTDNEACGSMQGSVKGGLSAFGRKAVMRMEKLNILIDLAHASAETIDDVLEVATKPVIVSHTGVKGRNDNNRNLSDSQLKKIAAGGGLICIGYWNTAVGGDSPRDIARSIRYATDLVGVEHVGLGLDFDGAVKMPFDAAGMALITEALMNDDFTDKEIKLIMGENVLNLLRKTLPKQ